MNAIESLDASCIQTEIRAGIAKGKYCLLLPCALGFVALGVYIVCAGGASWIGLLLITLFGVCSGVFLRQLTDNMPRLILNAEGLLDQRLDVGLLRWSDIRTVKLERLQGHAFIVLSVRPERLPAEILYISLSGLTASASSVVQMIESKISSHPQQYKTSGAAER